MSETLRTEMDTIFRKCPTCELISTFVMFETTSEDAKGDIRTQTYHRCLKCLGLFTEVLEEVEK